MKQSNTRPNTPFKAPFLRSTDENNNTLSKTAMLVPAANVDETTSEYILTIASPGFKRENFGVMIEKDHITVSATKENLTGDLIHDRCEYDYSCWKRSFSLPVDADALMTRARYRNGELIIRIPRGKTDQSSYTTTIYVY
jgi:HSP20 family protein